MNLYSTEITVIATLYIVAESEAEAREKIAELPEMAEMYLDEGAGQEIPVDGSQFSPDMPEVSVSPVTTLYRPKDIDQANIDLHEEFDMDVEGQEG